MGNLAGVLRCQAEFWLCTVGNTVGGSSGTRLSRRCALVVVFLVVDRNLKLFCISVRQREAYRTLPVSEDRLSQFFAPANQAIFVLF